MTATELPLRPAGDGAGQGANAQHAPARTREGERRTFIRGRMPSPVLVSGVLEGAGWISRPSPSVAAIWGTHVAAANYYRRWWSRGLRKAFGVPHVVLAMALYSVLWMFSSPPLLASSAVVTLLTLWLTGMI